MVSNIKRQKTNFSKFIAALSNQIRIDILCESSAGRRFTQNIKLYFNAKIYLKK